jgi:hypothetical protein
LSFRASEARPGIQSRSERDSKNSGFRRNDGVSDFCKSLKKKLFGAENAEFAEVYESKKQR